MNLKKILTLLLSAAIFASSSTNAKDEITATNVLSRTEYPFKITKIINNSGFKAIVNINKTDIRIKGKLQTKAKTSQDKTTKKKSTYTGQSKEYDGQYTPKDLYIPLPQKDIMIINLVDSEEINVLFTYIIINTLRNIIIIDPLGDFVRHTTVQEYKTEETMPDDGFKIPTSKDMFRSTYHLNGSCILTINQDGTLDLTKPVGTTTPQEVLSKKTEIIYNISPNKEIGFKKIDNQSPYKANCKILMLEKDPKNDLLVTTRDDTDQSFYAGDFTVQANKFIKFSKSNIPMPHQGCMIINLLDERAPDYSKESPGLVKTYTLFQTDFKVIVAESIAKLTGDTSKITWSSYDFPHPSEKFVLGILKIDSDGELTFN